MCKIARPSQQQQSFCYAFAGDCSPKAYSTEFFRVVIRGYVRLCVCLSVSLSLNLYNREGTYFNEFIIIPYYLVHMTFARSRVKGQATEARQRRPRKSCELDRFRTAEEISTKTFMQSGDKLITFTRSWIQRSRSQTMFFKNALFQRRHAVWSIATKKCKFVKAWDSGWLCPHPRTRGFAPVPRWRNHKSHLKTKLAPPTLEHSDVKHSAAQHSADVKVSRTLIHSVYCWYVTIKTRVTLIFDILTLNVSVCQIWAKSNNLRRSYCNLNMSNFGTFAIMDLTGCGFSQCGLRDPYCTSVSNFNTMGQCAAELLMIQPIYTAWFSGINFVPAIS